MTVDEYKKWLIENVQQQGTMSSINLYEVIMKLLEALDK